MDSPTQPQTQTPSLAQLQSQSQLDLQLSAAIEGRQSGMAEGQSTSTLDLGMPPSHIQYGYIVSNTVGHRFVAKRINQHFYVKFPGEGIVRFDNLLRVGTFLNR